MSRNSKLSMEEKIQCVEECLNSVGSIRHIAKTHGISVTTLMDLISRYKCMGIKGITASSKNRIYSSTLKKQAVEDYLSGRGFQSDICKKYEILSRCQLRQWIKVYNSHEKLKTSGTGGMPIMTKGRITTYEERIEIVEYCIEHENNYAETAEKYKVSYQQVYTWIKKYRSNGVEVLQDRRGRTKPESEMSEIEKLRAENRLLKAENKRHEMEMAFLKKLDEVERRRF